jgi:hypothetical protein
MVYEDQEGLKALAYGDGVRGPGRIKSFGGGDGVRGPGRGGFKETRWATIMLSLARRIYGKL